MGEGVPETEKLEELLTVQNFLVVVVFVQFGVIGFLLADSGAEGKKVVEKQPEEPKLSKYQRNYVSCPDKYLQVCTELSKVGTQKVEFRKVEEGVIHLKMEDGRTLMAKLKNGGKDAEIIAMK